MDLVKYIYFITVIVTKCKLGGWKPTKDCAVK